MTCRQRVQLATGRELSALDIQREFLEAALNYSDRRGFSGEETTALRMWEHCITAIERDPLELDTEVDWVIKYKLIEAYRERHGLALGDPQVQLVDLQYHDVSRQRGMFFKLEQRGRAKRICNDDSIDLARQLPPQTTRARLRGEFIRRARERGRDVTVDWVHLKVNDQAQRTVLCKDPFASTDERVERLMQQL
jgi:proteasome accessory factor A